MKKLNQTNPNDLKKKKCSKTCPFIKKIKKFFGNFRKIDKKK